VRPTHLGPRSFPTLGPDELTGSVADRFRTVAAALPDSAGLVSPGSALTFAEADARSDAVAAMLHARLGPGDEPVAMLLDQTVDGLVALLGVFKSGRAVVPLDPLVPTARHEQIVRRAGASACLTDTAHATAARALAPTVSTIIDVADTRDDPGATSAARPVEAVPAARPGRGAGDTAVIVFTSGSTGTPKGVVWTHATLLNEAYAGQRRLGFAPGDRTALVLPYSFAAGLTVVVFAVLNGAGVYAYDPRALGIRDLPAWLASHHLTTLHTTPSLLRSLLGALEPDEQFADLRLVTSGGEPVHGRDVALLRPHLPPSCTFVNWSGASEVGSLAFFEVGPEAPVPVGVLPAGLPAAGKEIAIVRDDGMPAATGETGEDNGHLRLPLRRVLAAGLRSGRAFHPPTRRPHHIPDRRPGPHRRRRHPRAAGQARLRRQDPWLPGRAERGRSRPACPRRHRGRGGDHCGGPAGTHQVGRLRRARRRRQDPVADRHPPGAAGRAAVVDGPRDDRRARRATPQRTGQGRPGRPARARPPGVLGKPRTQWEIVVADLWTRVLNLEEVGLGDDFMELGGDSLAAEELLAAVSEKVGVHLPSSALIDAPTLGEFAERVAQAPRAHLSHPTVVPLRTEGTRPPLFCFAGAGGPRAGVRRAGPPPGRRPARLRVPGARARAARNPGLDGGTRRPATPSDDQGTAAERAPTCSPATHWVG
jgi:acyl carrier protein